MDEAAAWFDTELEKTEWLKLLVRHSYFQGTPYLHPPKTNMPPKKGTVSKKGSNLPTTIFFGDMLWSWLELFLKMYLEFTTIARMQSSPPGLFYIGSSKIKRWFTAITGCGVDPKISCWQITLGKKNTWNFHPLIGWYHPGCFGLRFCGSLKMGSPTKWKIRQEGENLSGFMWWWENMLAHTVRISLIYLLFKIPGEWSELRQRKI